MSVPGEHTAVTEPTVSQLRREVSELRRELREQRTVGPAVGLLAARLGCDPEQARARLVELARAYGVPLVDAAAAVIAAPEAPPAVADPIPAARKSDVLDGARILARSSVRQPTPGPAIPEAPAGPNPGAPAAPSPAATSGPAAPEPVAGEPAAMSAGAIADIQAVLDMLPGAVALNLPIRDADGEIVDYRAVAVSPGSVDFTGRRGRELVGLRTLESYPSLAGSELMRAYAQVMATGQAREIGPFTYVEERAGAAVESLYSVRAHRLGNGLLVTWVRHDEERRYAARLARAERLGNLGWAEWDLTTDTIYWSDQVYEIFERDPAAGPAPLTEIVARVLPEDVPALEAATTGLLEDRRPMDVTYRFAVSGGVRHVRSVFEGQHDPKGRPVLAYGIVQDVSAVAAAERDRRRLADIERQLAERQHTLQTEHRLVATLQQVILPLPTGPIELNGLQVGVRYEPAEQIARIGGDWFDVVPLPCGRTLLAVGDVAGHGITAAATMAKLRHALTALAVTTNEPAELLEYLNRVVCDDPSEPTATVVVARYDPHAATLTWAQAGHPPPVLITDGRAAPVPRPRGMIVGARRDTRYGTAELRLPADSRLLLFTDGLIERRGRFEPDWLGPLLAALAGADREPLDVLLGRLQPANPDDDTCVLVMRPLPA